MGPHIPEVAVPVVPVEKKGRKTGKEWLAILAATGRQWQQHNILQLSAALAYYSIFSIAPLLIIAVALVGRVYGPEAVYGELERQLRTTMGSAAASAIQSMVQSAY